MKPNAQASTPTGRTSQSDALTERYVKGRVVALAETVMARQRIYLDLNFWLRLRDVALGRRSEPALVSILASLRRSVREATLICPISESTFLELMKQQDSNTRLATAELIDELSEGVAIAPLRERMATEVAHFMHAALGHDVLKRTALVWSKLGYILGIVHPYVEGLDPGDQSALQVAFVDRMWNVRLSEILPMLDVDAAQPAEMAGIAERLNAANATHSGAVRSFRQVYEDEFVGSLELAADVGHQVIERMWLDSGVDHMSPSQEQRQRGREQVFALLRATFDQRRDRIVSALPTLHVGALCHAAVRWDKKRKLSGNDLMDFHHAQVALPYCDAFLTDGPLRTMLQQGHVGIQKHYTCRIISAPEEAATYLQ